MQLTKIALIIGVISGFIPEAKPQQANKPGMPDTGAVKSVLTRVADYQL